MYNSEERALKVRHTCMDYSLAFKLQVVDEVEKGYFTAAECRRRYGIQGKSTILKWLRKHGNLNWQSRIQVKKRQPPKKLISQLEAKIKQLEAEKEILNRAIDIADDMLQTNIRKKYLPLSQKASGKQQGGQGDSVSGK